MGSLLAFAAQAYLDEQLGAGEAPTVSAALFAPPNVGPAAFVSNFNRLVNARRIAYDDDIVAQVCSWGWGIHEAGHAAVAAELSRHIRRPQMS